MKKNHRIILLLILIPGFVFSQNGTAVDINDVAYPYWEYWPVLLLPIFGIVIFRLWRKRNSSKKQ